MHALKNRMEALSKNLRAVRNPWEKAKEEKCYWNMVAWTCLFLKHLSFRWQWSNIFKGISSQEQRETCISFIAVQLSLKSHESTQKEVYFSIAKKSCPWQCDRERLHSQNSGIKSQPLSTCDSPGGPDGAADVQLTVEGRERRLIVGVSWASHGSGVYLLCSHSTDHYSSPKVSATCKGKFKTYMPMGKVQWTPAESQNTSSFQLADTYFTFLCIK